MKLYYLLVVLCFCLSIGCTPSSRISSPVGIAIGDSLDIAKLWAQETGLQPIEYTPSLAWAGGEPPKEFLESVFISYEKRFNDRTITLTLQVFNGKIWSIHRFEKDSEAKFGYPDHRVLEKVDASLE